MNKFARLIDRDDRQFLATAKWDEQDEDDVKLEFQTTTDSGHRMTLAVTVTPKENQETPWDALATLSDDDIVALCIDAPGMRM